MWVYDKVIVPKKQKHAAELMMFIYSNIRILYLPVIVQLNGSNPVCSLYESICIFLLTVPPARDSRPC